ncbi:FMN-dependent NADH-azoreductase [Xylophilus rhododendri]|uniref:FMN dependent NADH:quinone oxidoreductase n=1 Tax=Xylophilus rhododendri TaxID=2697032 RepID=A0A857J5G1_9BURK|nr:NAD(P)H-dependent oxidoreductase [Xylophilus rhododendri]QHI98078.1 FMN-dependent NADH-azoreductase [Xylophilus rhododendri]
MKVLHLDSSSLGAVSVSRQIGAAVAAELAGASGSVVYRDLTAQPIAHLDGNLIAAMRPAPGATPPEDAAVKAELALNETLLAELFASEAIVIGAPMYNFSVPSQLKAWIDRVAQAGRTFRYGASGPEGLVGDRKVVIVSSRGGKYAGMPFEAALDHQEAYLRGVLGFFGIKDVTVIRAEGIGMGPEARDAAIAAALAQVDGLTAAA